MMRLYAAGCSLTGVLCLVGVARGNVIDYTDYDITFDPFEFNVFSLGDIGTTSAAYHSDFQGIAGLGGDAYFSSFSLHDIATAGPGTPTSLYAGGDVRITGSINNGGIEAGGSVFVNGANVDGTIRTGGDLDGTGGTVLGDAVLGGSDLTGLPVTVFGTVSTGVSFEASLDLSEVSEFFLDTSSLIGGMPATTPALLQYGEILIDVESGINVVEISSAALNAAWGVRISGPADATLIINVPDAMVAFDALVWNYQNGMSAGHTLLNLASASTFSLSNGDHQVNILAPRADTYFPHGLVTGNLIAGSLIGGGQVNDGGFEGQIPEPTTLGLMGIGACALLLARRRPGASGPRAATAVNRRCTVGSRRS